MADTFPDLLPHCAAALHTAAPSLSVAVALAALSGSPDVYRDLCSAASLGGRTLDAATAGPTRLDADAAAAEWPRCIFLYHAAANAARWDDVGSAAANAPVDVQRPRPGEIPVPNLEPITVRPWRPTLVPNTNPVRTLTRDMVTEARADITSLVDTCYSAAMVMVPEMSGQFGLRIAVEPSGNVSRVEVQDQNSLAGPLRECIIVLGRRLQFHSSGGGAVVSVDVALSQSEGATPGVSAAPTAGSVGAPGATIGTPTGVGAPQGGLMPMIGTPR